MAPGLLFVSLLAAELRLERLLEAQTPAPDLIIVNAKIYTVEPAFSTAQALATFRRQNDGVTLGLGVIADNLIDIGRAMAAK